MAKGIKIHYTMILDFFMILENLEESKWGRKYKTHYRAQAIAFDASLKCCNEMVPNVSMLVIILGEIRYFSESKYPIPHCNVMLFNN